MVCLRRACRNGRNAQRARCYVALLQRLTACLRADPESHELAGVTTLFSDFQVKLVRKLLVLQDSDGSSEVRRFGVLDPEPLG